MKKALMYASVASMIQQFNLENIRVLQELGYKVDVACNFKFGSTISQEKIDKLKIDLKNMNVDFYHIPIPRKTTDINNLKKSYYVTKDLINKEKYDLIHCHSPIGGIICRIANKNSNCYNTSRMIYTAHGFHFFRGNNPLKNFVFRNIEKYGAKYTDTLITINKEDYEAAKNFKLKKNGTVEYVPGVGVDIDKINSIKADRNKLINELGISKNSILLISVGELNDNKNHKVIIESLPQLSNNLHYLICGLGPLKNQYIQLAKELGVSERLHLLGYRTDVIEVLKSCDIFIFPSKREGLSVALMEAMACGLPCIVSNIRGNIDLIKDTTFHINDTENIERLIKENIKLPKKSYTAETLNQISSKKITKKMKEIYDERNYKKKNVLHILKSNVFSGAENVVCQIIKMLENDFNMFYCSPDGSIKEKLDDYKIKYIPILGRFSPFTFRKIIKKNQVDIIHAHDPGACVISAFSFTSNKIIAHVHGNHDNMKKISLKSILFLIASLRFNKIIWVSKSCLNDYCFSRMVKNKSEILINTINPDEIFEKINSDEIENFDCIYLGRLSTEKNPLRAMKVIKEVVKKSPDFKAIFVGQGDLYQECLNFIKKNNLDNNICMAGYKKNPYPYLFNSKVLLMTSVYEGTPMSALEAMCLGKPIVSTPTDGLVELIIPEETGFYSNEDEKLAQYLIKLKTNNNCYIKLSEKSKERFKNINNIENYIKKIKKFYC